MIVRCLDNLGLHGFDQGLERSTLTLLPRIPSYPYDALSSYS